jgi:lipopolysaccharide/colanic/teichoic acid biosynthesis glycosyltransferase
MRIPVVRVSVVRVLVKRSMDVALSAVLLLIALPVLLLAALIIRVTSPGPILFRQTRMGRKFQPFQILKLRTMAHAEGGLAYTLGPDPRITPFGNFLRRSKLDELPQLWNVLIGEMSLVGPRPVLPELTNEFSEYYAFLLSARPGLTDPASLKYSQETRLLARAADPLYFFKAIVTPDKIRISFEYMGRATLWSDIATLTMTVVICCIPSMSRMYGELPDTPRGPIKQAPRRVIAIKRQRPPVDDSIFTHQLALVEAAVEQAPHRDALPWIHLPNPNFKPRSAPSSAKESA